MTKIYLNQLYRIMIIHSFLTIQIYQIKHQNSICTNYNTDDSFILNSQN